MNFAITWLFDKLGYMPKIDMQVGKVNLDVKPPEFQMWPFPAEQEKSKARKTAVKKTVAKKTTKVVKKAK
jgi:hypothetical protein